MWKISWLVLVLKKTHPFSHRCLQTCCPEIPHHNHPGETVTGQPRKADKLISSMPPWLRQLTRTMPAKWLVPVVTTTLKSLVDTRQVEVGVILGLFGLWDPSSTQYRIPVPDLRAECRSSGQQGESSGMEEVLCNHGERLPYGCKEILIHHLASQEGEAVHHQPHLW